MEKSGWLMDSVLLLDNYGEESSMLRQSFRKAGFKGPVIVIEDDGFFPEDVISVYQFLCGDFQTGNPGKARFFNQIDVPDYWEISGNNSNGQVCDLHHERGRIFYAEPKHKRLVKVVDWYDEKHVVRSSDHYNRYGALYARTVFNAKGQKVNRSYFSADGREVIVENYVTGDIILNEGERVYFFQNRTELAVHVMKRAGLIQKRLFFNSLSIPFFVSQRLHSEKKRDILFWQEPVQGEIPGNMQIILQGQASRTAEVLVQKRESYDRLLKLGAPAELVHPLGFIYPFERENLYRPEALICTNSDQIEQCRKLVEALPEMHFHIAAITEMSSKLMRMDSYKNVSLYPGVKARILDELFALILAFQETLHNPDYTAAEHIFEAKDAQTMIRMIRETMQDAEAMDRHLHIQRAAAYTETKESYRRFGEG